MLIKKRMKYHRDRADDGDEMVVFPCTSTPVIKLEFAVYQSRYAIPKAIDLKKAGIAFRLNQVKTRPARNRTW